MTESNQNTTYQ